MEIRTQLRRVIGLFLICVFTIYLASCRDDGVSDPGNGNGVGCYLPPAQDYTKRIDGHSRSSQKYACGHAPGRRACAGYRRIRAGSRRARSVKYAKWCF